MHEPQNNAPEPQWQPAQPPQQGYQQPQMPPQGQPPYPPQVPQKPKRKGLKIAGAVVGSFLMLIIAVSALSGGGGSSDAVTEPDTTSAPAEPKATEQPAEETEEVTEDVAEEATGEGTESAPAQPSPNSEETTSSDRGDAVERVAFLQVVRANIPWLAVESDEDLVSLGYAAADAYHAGASLIDVVDVLVENGFSYEESGYFAGAAITAFGTPGDRSRMDDEISMYTQNYLHTLQFSQPGLVAA